MKPKRSSCAELGCPALYEACLWKGDGNRPAHIVVVSGCPSSFSVGEGKPFCGEHGRLFKNIMNFVRKYKEGRYADIRVYYTYAALAALPAGANDPTKKMLDACRSNLMQDIFSVRGMNGEPPVLVTLGPVPSRAVGLKFKSIYDVAGRVLSLSLHTAQGQQQYKVMPLMSMRDVQANPGKVNVEVASLLKAAQLATEGRTESQADLGLLTQNYVYPQTNEEVEKVVDEIIEYHNKESSVSPDNWLLAVDTETNTVHPHKEDARVLMASVAWDNGRAATILLDHDKCPEGCPESYDKERAWQAVGRLLASPKPKAFHNAKFDLKFLDFVHGRKINRIAWDTMLGEHYLDEDKKGLYSLKKLTTLYTPAYEGYDEELQNVLRAADKLDEEGRDAKGNLYITDEEIIQYASDDDAPPGVDGETWKQLAADIKKYAEAKGKEVPGWVNPALSQRLAAMAKEREQLRRNKQPIGSLKDAMSQVRKALKADLRIVKSELRERIAATKKELKIKKVTKNTPSRGGKRGGGFEQIPLEQILQYAAADADVTRRIAKEQLRRLSNTGHFDDGMSVMGDLYLAATPVLSDMEFHGVKIDLPYLDEIEGAIREIRDRVAKELAHNFDPTINYASPAQVAPLMQKMGFRALPGIEAGSTKHEALDKYRTAYPDTDPRHVLADKLIEFRAADKALGGFLVKLKQSAKRDGRIHCQFHLNGTATGRLCVAGDTRLVTSHGTFCISELDLQNNQNMSIMTHKGRMRRILRKYFKGFERMVRIRLDDGSSIVCTRGHRLLTPQGWRQAGESTIGTKICGPRPTGNTNPRSAFGFIRAGVCSDTAERGIDRKRGPREIQHQPPHVAHVDSGVWEEVRQGTSCCTKEKLRSIQVRKQTRCSGTFGEVIETETSESAPTRICCGSYRRKDGNIPVVCSTKHAALRSRAYCPTTEKDAVNRFLFSGEIGAPVAGNHEEGASGALLRSPTRVFRRAVPGICTSERTSVVHSGASQNAPVLRREGKDTEGPHLLVEQPSGAAAIDGTAVFGGCARSRVHVLQKLPGRLLVPRHEASRGNRRGISLEGHPDQTTRQAPRRARQATRLPSAAVSDREGISGRHVGSAEHPERTVIAIEDAGIQDVWDIEVEEDHSYVAQGMIHHNSSSEPNLQNIPKYMCRITKTETSDSGAEKEIVVHPGYNIKKVFVPSKPGHKIVNMDIKGAELRVYTAYSHDKKMIDAILNGDDIHSIACSQIYGIPYEEIVAKKETDPDIIEKRTRAKRTIFGSLYGAGPWKISHVINSTVEEAEKVQNGLFQAFPALPRYVEKTKNKVREQLFVKTVFGRCRRFRLARLGGSYYASACREAVNFLIQSTASDLLLSQMCEMAEPIKRDLGGQLLITVHDSVVFELPEENVSKLKAFFDHYVVERVAEKYDWLPVPFLYDYEVGDNYGEVYPKGEDEEEGG